MNKIKVLIVDDHQMSALGAQAMIKQDDAIEVVGIVNSGEEAIKFIIEKKPDILLLDVLMPNMDGFDTLKKIKNNNLDVKVVLLTISEDKETIYKSLAYKADGFLLKNVEKDEIVNTIKKVYNDDHYFSLSTFEIIFDDIVALAENMCYSLYKEINFQKDKSRISNGFNKENIREKLTQREYEILSEIGEGLSTKEIAERFNLSLYTVSTYRKNLHYKLGINNLKELLEIARMMKRA
jgi:DNA-binding NarL/FixJ family response regulator